MRRSRKIVVVFILIAILILLGIEIKEYFTPIKIYPLKKVEHCGSNYKEEYYIVYGTKWKKEEAIIDSIRKYNARTISLDTLSKYKEQYYRAFYKKTRQLNRDYEECAASGDYIEDFALDRIFSFQWMIEDSLIFVKMPSSFYRIPIKNLKKEYVKDPFLIPEKYQF